MRTRAGSNRAGPGEQRARQPTRARRRRRAGTVALAALAAGTLIAVPNITADRPTPLRDIGVPRDAAGCNPVRYDRPEGVGRHVAPGTTIDYATVPPSSGPHVAVPAAVDSRGFYTPADSPPVEALVHKLEHGYTIAWYTPDLAARDLDALRELTGRLRQGTATAKFVAAPWDPARGQFPPETPLALSHWGVAHGYRQFCTHVSGAAVHTFMIRHPAGDSPEPLAP